MRLLRFQHLEINTKGNIIIAVFVLKACDREQIITNTLLSYRFHYCNLNAYISLPVTACL